MSGLTLFLCREQNKNMATYRDTNINWRSNKNEILYVGVVIHPERTAFDDVEAFHAVGGYCSQCERVGWLNRWEVARKWGRTTYLKALMPHLKCMGCGNKERNSFVLGLMPRD